MKEPFKCRTLDYIEVLDLSFKKSSKFEKKTEVFLKRLICCIKLVGRKLFAKSLMTTSENHNLVFSGFWRKKNIVNWNLVSFRWIFSVQTSRKKHTEFFFSQNMFRVVLPAGWLKSQSQSTTSIMQKDIQLSDLRYCFPHRNSDRQTLPKVLVLNFGDIGNHIPP